MQRRKARSPKARAGGRGGAEPKRRRESRLQQLPSPPAELATKQLATARAAQESLAARIAAEKAKYGFTPDADKEQLALAAGKAERELALCQAQEQQAAAATGTGRRQSGAQAERRGDRECRCGSGEESCRCRHGARRRARRLGRAEREVSAARRTVAAPEHGPPAGVCQWLVDRKNPLAARVAINHIWLRHFGAPLVDNMFDFGLRSPQPRNQPLLDWLAVELMDHGWQMKHIHRLLVTSNAYRMSSGIGRRECRRISPPIATIIISGG